jgi:DNA repair protein RadD
MFSLRPYQQAACDAALAWMRRSVDPCLIDAAPAAGKSFMIAYIANALHKISCGKRVLCLAPNAELVTQNHEKYLLTGEYASIFSASAGAKSTRHVVVFGTPKTVKNAISRFCKQGNDGFCAVIVDEAHGITPTIKSIIEAMREANPNLRVLGLSGTPFRLGSGYIYKMWPDNKVNDDGKARDPYFMKCVYRVSAREMLDGGFITPMVVGSINQDDAYDTSGLELLPNGTFNPSTVERAFVGHGRKTALIVADVLEKSRARAGGIMYFAATVQHAREVLASLPQGTSGLVTGDSCQLGNGDPISRDRLIAMYRAGDVRHLVSVGTLTTGFDVSHTEVIALLRATESAALLQQILGRSWRLHQGKDDCLLLDYAGNVERHFPDGDIYNPVIKASGAGKGEADVSAICPDCGYNNLFTLVGDRADFKHDANGYCLDVFGERVQTEFGPLPAHHGRRCQGMLQTAPGINGGRHVQCGYFWTSKPCPQCETPNDISARYCSECKAEIVNPNEKLIGDFKAMKRDPTRRQTDKVLQMTVRPGISSAGNPTVRADWVTPYRQFSTWHMPEAKAYKGQADWAMFDAATAGGTQKPDTITYRKDAESGFYQVLAFNKPEDAEPEPAIWMPPLRQSKRKIAA